MAIKLLKTLIAVVALATMFAVGYIARAAKHSTPANGRKVLYYVDPMHPAYKSDKPGIAPDCGMTLEPVYADDPRGNPTADKGLLNVSPEQQRLIGVEFGQAELTASSTNFRAVGKVAQDETRLVRIHP